MKNRKSAFFAAIFCGVIFHGSLFSLSTAAAQAQDTAATHAEMPGAPKLLKRKVAIARFTNITRYGKSLLSDGDKDPLAEQAADMLTARLVDSGKFLVFERSSKEALAQEASLSGAKGSGVTGVDAVVVGSVTEFGRKTDGVAGFLNSTLRQTANATVEVRLVDVRTGQAFFASKGVGKVEVTAKEIAGFGGRAGYDATITDKAISAAISDLINNVIEKLEERPWSSDVLQVRNGTVFISGGPSQGLKVGDRLAVETRGDTVTSRQTGLPITLPGEHLAEIEVASFFGESASGEGAVARVVSGSVTGHDTKDLVVLERH